MIKKFKETTRKEALMSRRGSRKFFVKTLQRQQCMHTQVIQRSRHKNQATDHIKHLYCIHCKSRTPHQEIDPFALAHE
ncbi:MAG: hypothetical protein HY006_02165 [Candidatus Sungbacteria bacterium]|nr:hypothetical protein [Candidatus Sungbacteria bacterium]